MGTFMGPGALSTPKYQEEHAVAPKGWERTIRKMKKSGDIDNPWRLAWWMKKRGMHPSRKQLQAQLQILLHAAATESRPIPQLFQAASAGDQWAQAQVLLALYLVRGLKKV